MWNYILNSINYIDQEAYQRAKEKLYEIGDLNALTDDEWMSIIMYGSHVGDVMRLTYYKFVHKLGFNPKAYWDALIMALLLGLVWNNALENALKDKRIKALINRTRYPRWTVYGLVGGKWSDIQRDARKFCAYMDELEAKYEKEVVSNQ